MPKIKMTVPGSPAWDFHDEVHMFMTWRLPEISDEISPQSGDMMIPRVEVSIYDGVRALLVTHCKEVDGRYPVALGRLASPLGEEMRLPAMAGLTYH